MKLDKKKLTIKNALSVNEMIEEGNSFSKSKGPFFSIKQVLIKENKKNLVEA